MKSLTEYVGQKLRWQPVEDGVFELHAGEATLATLQFRSRLGSFAIGETGAGSWTFKRMGVFRTHLTVRLDGVDVDLAIFRRGPGLTDTLHFSGGAVFTFGPTSGGSGEVAFVDARSRVLVRMRPAEELFSQEEAIEISPQAAAVPELSVLALLGFYVHVLQVHDEVLAAGAMAGQST